MTALFKRILSPRESGRGRQDDPLNQNSIPASPSASSVSGASGYHGHLRGSDTDTMVVDNVIYSEPTQLDRVAPRGGSAVGGGGGGGGGEGQPLDQPPLPPRPPSASSGQAHQVNSGDNETYYCAPIDTLGRGLDLQKTPSLHNKERERDRERERRQRDTHEKIMHQKQLQQGYSPVTSGHRRTYSGGQMVDTSEAEYSTPWNVREESQKKEDSQRRSSGPPPRKPPHVSRKPPGAGKGIPATPSDGSDNVIPVSPPPILSASHDRSQSSSPVPPRSPIGGGAEAEYDDPWDVKNRNISQVIPSQHHGRHSHVERRSPPTSEHRLPRHSVHSVSSKQERPRHFSPEDPRRSRGLSERGHPRGGGGTSGSVTESVEPFRSRTTTDLHSLSISSSSTSSQQRTSSVSIPIQKRPLPQEPGGNPLPIKRENSPSTWFESHIALEEQP